MHCNLNAPNIGKKRKDDYFYVFEKKDVFGKNCTTQTHNTITGDLQRKTESIRRVELRLLNF